jgi:hypothetical protein
MIYLLDYTYEQLNQMTKDQLIDILRNRLQENLKLGGLKEELIQRILRAQLFILTIADFNSKKKRSKKSNTNNSKKSKTSNSNTTPPLPASSSSSSSSSPSPSPPSSPPPSPLPRTFDNTLYNIPDSDLR